MFFLDQNMIVISLIIFAIGIILISSFSFLGKRIGVKGSVKIESKTIFLFQILVLAPVIEELSFRSWILLINDPLVALIFIFISSFLFGCRHLKKSGDGISINLRGNIMRVVHAIIIGLLLGFLVFKARSIAIAMILHAGFNLFSFLINYQSEGKKWEKKIEQVTKDIRKNIHRYYYDFGDTEKKAQNN